MKRKLRLNPQDGRHLLFLIAFTLCLIFTLTFPGSGKEVALASQTVILGGYLGASWGATRCFHQDYQTWMLRPRMSEEYYADVRKHLPQDCLSRLYRKLTRWEERVAGYPDEQ